MAGKANKLIFADSEKARDAITTSQQKEIAKLYEDWAKDLGDRAEYYRNKTTDSSALSERQAKELQKALTEQSKQVSNEVYNNIKQNIYIISDTVVKDNVEWLKSLGFSGSNLDAAFSSIPDDIVRMLITGQIYEGGWNLSSRIWSSNEKTLSNCYQIVAKGMAENRPIYDIAKELEKYVSPQTAKSWNPILRTKNTKTGEWEYKRIYRGKVDYNAQRLARTLVQHGYQQSFIAVTEKNPFVLKYQWSANGSRVCPICQDRDGQMFEKGDLPMDHPNGMCTMIPVIDDQMLDKLADWFNSPDDTYPEIDEFAKEFGYSASQFKETKQATAAQAAQAVPYDTWIKLMQGQTESSMLSIEEGQVAKMTESQLKGIRRYSSDSYEEMNGYLRLLAAGRSDEVARDMSDISDSQVKAIKEIQTALKNAALTQDTYLRRGTDLGDLAGFMPGNFGENKAALGKMSVEELREKFVGAQGTYAGFTSTSSLYDRGFIGNVEVIIRAPAGTEATSIMSVSRHGAGEGETLLNSGAKVEIKEIEKSDGHMGSNIRVYMEIIKG